MWKYVSRRVKETFERKCKVLDVRQSFWVCKAPQQQQHQHHQPQHENGPKCRHHLFGPAAADPGYLCVVVANRGECGIPYAHCENWDRARAKGHKNNKRRGCPVSEILGAITWSGAIIFGWYASQLMCLQRRHTGWDKCKSRYLQMLQSPTRAIHSSFLSHFVLASPNYPSLLAKRTLLENFSPAPLTHDEPDGPQAAVFDVSNDSDISSAPSSESQKQNVDEAVADLVTFLGETEYKMGIKCLSAGLHRQAVAHLKLATSHNHPGATFNLGLCYEKGLGLPKNPKRAMECYQIASSMGHPKAMYNLGVFYARGLGGLEKDYAAAKKCFVTAAQLGQAEAIDALNGFPKRPKYEDEDRSNLPPMTELIFEKNKTEIFAAAAKFT